jgi:hypothetical protein
VISLAATVLIWRLSAAERARRWPASGTRGAINRMYAVHTSTFYELELETDDPSN